VAGQSSAGPMTILFWAMTVLIRAMTSLFLNQDRQQYAGFLGCCSRLPALPGSTS
jgi:hypothetical protein